ncbi:hypothetical protein FQN52_002989 [Onygenales sp. PD_12]|nr:hypothetical protein FQN52_002989 [Onygenales sp. PD_12]KAK2790306.1 hypothetical protein FQN53_000072 [Emmonsiellopsis sp. PD_33]
MGDSSKPKAASIPSWQLPAGNAPSDTTAAPANTETEKADSPSKETLLEQASRFLDDESIRDAPTDKKIAFLESKGLQNDDIQKLLGISRNPEATNSDTIASTTDLVKSETTPTQTPQPNTPAATTSAPQATSNQPAPTSASPPIITYPEFLLQASKPPPLVTFQGVLYTLYGAAGLAATIYGASQYLVTPMLGALTGARHELAETAQSNLKTLNEKLEDTVSVIPPMKSSLTSSDEAEQHLDDADSITSDPTELFHRDIATQTSPELSQSTSTSTPSSENSETNTISASERAMNNHVKRLESIKSQLNEVQTDEDHAGKSHANARDRMTELQTYLDSLMYSSPPYLGSNLYGIPNGDGISGNGSKEEDAIAAFKTEIRSVKGTLLSARNFPAGGGIRSSMTSTGAR